jgi:uncharacterized protein (DUF362 family)/ferredoxin
MGITGKDVAITRCGDYRAETVEASIREVLRLLGGVGEFIRKGEVCLIKPNILAGRDPKAAVTTHPEVVRAVVRLVKEAGATPVVGDSPGIGSPRKAAQRSGILGVCEDEGAAFVEFKDAVAVENPGGHTFKRLEVAREALEADCIINVAKLKTHAQMYLTLGVKNVFGCVPGARKPQWHLSAGVDNLHFAGMLLDLYLFLKPRLTVMDAVVGMEGNGPAAGAPRALGLIFASPDAIAMDAIAAEVLGADPGDVPILKAALARGIREADARGVNVLGERPAAVKVNGFKFPPPMSANFAAWLPYFIERRVRLALTSRPNVERSGCTLCNVCVEVCPAEVMEKTDRILIDYDRCIRCYCCQEMCPQGAIAPREGWLKRVIPGL